MKSFLIGTAVGVAATLLVQQLLPGRDAAAPPAPVATASNQPTPMPMASAPLAAARSENSAASAVAAPTPMAIAKPATAGAAPAATSPLPPLQLSAEHARMLLEPTDPPPQQLTLQQRYARFLGEEQDPNWSVATAQLLRDYVASRNPRAEFDVRHVECRRTSCVITAFGNQPTSNQRWSELLREMRHEHWWSGFGGTSFTISEVNGRSVIATLLNRKTSEPPSR